jgi:hypothetical protein
MFFYYKSKYKFWSTQPVFHYYNIYYWLIYSGIILNSLPKKNEFYEEDIQLQEFDKLDENKVAIFVEFIKSNYLVHNVDDESEFYRPTHDSIIDCFEKLSDTSFITFHYYKNKLITTLTSRPLLCTIDNEEITTYYVDYLCVDQKFRKLGFAQKSIYSYYVNHCELLKSKDLVCLFKREDSKNIIVPLCSYKTFDYRIKDWELYVELDKKYSVISYNQDTKTLFQDYIKNLKDKFKCFITTTQENIEILVNKGHIFITGVKEGDKLLGIYVFHDSYTFYEEQRSLEFIASYKDDNLKPDDFIKGFSLSLLEIKKSKDFNRLLVEEVSHNLIIAYNLVQTYDPFEVSNSSFYIYNYARYPIACDKIFCLF